MSALIRYETPTLSNLLNNFFGDRVFNRGDRDISSTMFPSVDITESKQGFTIKADLPGVDKKDIKVEVANGVLTISGNKNSDTTERSDENFYHYERSYGSFSRSFKLPEHVDANAIDAKYVNGVLELGLKKTEAAKPRAIEVKVE